MGTTQSCATQIFELETALEEANAKAEELKIALKKEVDAKAKASPEDSLSTFEKYVKQVSLSSSVAPEYVFFWCSAYR